MAVADDAKLTQLAAEPSRELLVTLKGGARLRPLVVLLAVMPPLYAFAHYSLSKDETDVLWGLRALQLLSATSIGELVPSASGIASTDALKWAPPLGSWMTALTMRVAGPSRPGTLVWTSFLATTGAIAATFALFSRLFGSRHAFWSVLVVAFHSAVLGRVQSASACALSTMLAVCAVWAFVAHLQAGGGVVSFRLLAAGVALGLCLLAGGFVAVAVVAILLLFTLLLLLTRKPKPQNQRPRSSVPPADKRAVESPRSQPSSGNGKRGDREPARAGLKTLKSLPMLVLTAFAVGGWWVLMMAYRHGSDFWFGLLGQSFHAPGIGSGQPADAKQLAVRILADFVALTGVFCGLALFGLYRLVRDVRAESDPSRRQGLLLLLSWFGTALGVWLACAAVSSATADTWRVLLVLPVVGLAALGVEAIANRRVHPTAAVFVVCATLVIPIEIPQLRELQADRPDSVNLELWRGVGLIVAFSGLGWLVGRRSRGGDIVPRVVLTVLILSVVAVGGWQGARVVRADPASIENDRVLAGLRRALRNAPDVESVLLVQDAAAPETLRFVVRSVYPSADFEEFADPGRAFAQARANVLTEDGSVLIAVWKAGPAFRPNASRAGVNVQSLFETEGFRRRSLRAYRIRR